MSTAILHLYARFFLSFLTSYDIDVQHIQYLVYCYFGGTRASALSLLRFLKFSKGAYKQHTFHSNYFPKYHPEKYGLLRA